VVALVALLRTEPGAAGAALPAEGRIVEPNLSSTTVLKRRFLEAEVRRRALGANVAAMAFQGVCEGVLMTCKQLMSVLRKEREDESLLLFCRQWDI